MAFLELKNIGKIYVTEGSVGVGIRGVNLSFDRHEFVAVTGQSGSGKSTLLNVISGIDSYEEGELFIKGEPTSHYMQQDWEEYRNKYISFIFQDYNIIESMTVLQNVELSLMDIDDPSERRRRAVELLRRVGMESHLHHKGSHLSGGQKQRTVIARALSKDSPIILADEPTGNLDSQSSKEIIELLREVSKDKLVIIVTHSFDEVEACATRHIRIFDGAIESDQRLAPANPEYEDENTENAEDAPKPAGTVGKKFKNLRNGITLGRVRFASKPKFSIFICVLFILATLAVTLISSMFGDIPQIMSKDMMFTHINGRVVISRDDGGVITDEELEKLASVLGAKSYIHYDYLLDYSDGIDFPEFLNIDTGGGSELGEVIYSCDTGIKPSVGRRPEADNEIMLSMPLSYQPMYGKDKIKIDTYSIGQLSYNVVGINYYYDNNKTPSAVFTESGFKLATAIALYSGSTTDFSVSITSDNELLSAFSSTFSPSQLFLSFDLDKDEYVYTVPYLDSMLKQLDDTLKSLEELGIKIDKEDLLESIKPSLTGKVTAESGSDDIWNWLIGRINGGDSTTTSDQYTLDMSSYRKSDKTYIANAYGATYGAFVMSPYIIEDFMEQLYYPDAYTQASIMFGNDLVAHMNVSRLERLGYTAVPSDTTVTSENYLRIIAIIGLFFEAVVWVLSMVFIALLIGFVTNKSMSATAGDIAIMRSMGIPVKVIKISIYVQTMIALIPSYVGMLLFSLIVFRIPETNAMFTYMYWWQYLIIALGVFIIDIRLSRRYVKRLFGASVKTTLRGGAAG